MQLVVQVDAQNRYQFYLAHRGGQYGFYFWIPGPGCTVDVDNVPTPVSPDRIVPDMGSVAEYTTAAFRGAAGL
jgi:hypothetical protein